MGDLDPGAAEELLAVTKLDEALVGGDRGFSFSLFGWIALDLLEDLFLALHLHDHGHMDVLDVEVFLAGHECATVRVSVIQSVVAYHHVLSVVQREAVVLAAGRLL